MCKYFNNYIAENNSIKKIDLNDNSNSDQKCFIGNVLHLNNKVTVTIKSNIIITQLDTDAQAM